VALFCRTFHGEFSQYFVGRFTVNFLCILSDVSPWIFSVFCPTFHGEFSRILSDISRWIFSVFCRTFHGEFPLYFVRRFTMKFLCILSDVSRWIFSVFCRTFHGKFSRYFVGRFTVNFLCILSDVWRWIVSTSFGSFTQSCFDIFSGVLWWNNSLSCLAHMYILSIFVGLHPAKCDGMLGDRPLWIVVVFVVTLSRYFVRHFTVNYLYIFVASEGKLSHYLSESSMLYCFNFFSCGWGWSNSSCYRATHLIILNICRTFRGEFWAFVDWSVTWNVTVFVRSSNDFCVLFNVCSLLKEKCMLFPWTMTSISWNFSWTVHWSVRHENSCWIISLIKKP
jgi:hypothetical protein